MAKITDLTFEQVNEAAISDPTIGVPIFSITGNVISLNLNALTSESFTDLDNGGFLELMYKLNRIANLTQLAVNETVTLPEEELTSFPSITFGQPSSEGNVAVTYVSNYSIPLNINNPMGTN